MDALEKRLVELQDELQSVEQPDRQAIWNGISRPVATKPTSALGRIGRWLAWAFLFLLIGATLGYWLFQKTPEQAGAFALEDLSPASQVELRRYERLAQDKEQAVRVNLPKGATDEGALTELQLLDSLHRQFLSDFPALPKDDRTTQHYLHYYEQKIRILELLLKEIKIQQNEQERNTQVQL
jgi:hypothetical protein